MNAQAYLPIEDIDNSTHGYRCFPAFFYVNGHLENAAACQSKGNSVSSRIDRLQANPKKAAALSKARQRIGGWLVDEKLPGTSLSALRLRAGLSQSQLAEIMGTQQANISRMEKAPGDLQFSTIQKLAAAFKITAPQLVEVLSRVTNSTDE